MAGDDARLKGCSSSLPSGFSAAASRPSFGRQHWRFDDDGLRSQAASRQPAMQRCCVSCRLEGTPLR
ncbi:unnamed protein product [Toxocara canis]|uniref:Uncharacterized protein n=1 Tax=Toxocara canis TaxID=6265 RepID=A0A183UTM7_TOXCA|nr:unnamed protein product [Toxocara canis]